MTTLDDLRKRFDSRNLEDIESDAKSFGKMASESREEFILTLYYLQTTHRFRENPRYKNEPFARYIWEQFNLRPNTFEQERRAFIAAPEASRKLGTGFVARVIRETGIHRLPEVLKEIDASKKQTAAEYDKIIQKHAKPEKKKQQAAEGKRKNIPPKEQKSPAEYIRREVFLEKRNTELEKLLVEKDEQITKLVSALSKYKEIEKNDKDEIKKLKGLLAQFHEMTARINKTASLYNGLTGMKG